MNSSNASNSKKKKVVFSENKKTNQSFIDTSEAASEHIDQISKQLFGIGINSENRLAKMLDILRDFVSRPEIIWPVFHHVWNCCDATFAQSDELIQFLDMTEYSYEGETGCSRNYLSSEDKAAFEALPEFIQIYRGASLSRIYGFSWTTDLKIAKTFARGHRCVTVPDPVIASLRICKNEVIGFYTSREESEVFINPDRIKNYDITVTKISRC